MLLVPQCELPVRGGMGTLEHPYKASANTRALALLPICYALLDADTHFWSCRATESLEHSAEIMTFDD